MQLLNPDNFQAPHRPLQHDGAGGRRQPDPNGAGRGIG